MNISFLTRNATAILGVIALGLTVGQGLKLLNPSPAIRAGDYLLKMTSGRFVVQEANQEEASATVAEAIDPMQAVSGDLIQLSQLPPLLVLKKLTKPAGMVLLSSTDDLWFLTDVTAKGTKAWRTSPQFVNLMPNLEKLAGKGRCLAFDARMMLSRSVGSGTTDWTVQVYNASPFTVQIKRVDTSCGCLRAEFKSAAVNPFDVAEVKMELDPARVRDEGKRVYLSLSLIVMYDCGDAAYQPETRAISLVYEAPEAVLDPTIPLDYNEQNGVYSGHWRLPPDLADKIEISALTPPAGWNLSRSGPEGFELTHDTQYTPLAMDDRIVKAVFVQKGKTFSQSFLISGILPEVNAPEWAVPANSKGPENTHKYIVEFDLSTASGCGPINFEPESREGRMVAATATTVSQIKHIYELEVVNLIKSASKEPNTFDIITWRTYWCGRLIKRTIKLHL